MIDPDLLVQAIDTAEHGVYLCDPAGTLMYVNPGFTRLCGYSREELIGAPISIIRSGTMSDDYYRKLWKTILAGERWQEEITNRKKDGSLYVAFQIVTPILGVNDTIVAFLGIQHDISNGNDAESLMRESAIELETIFSNTQDALFLVDVDGTRFTFRKLSRSHQLLTGMSGAEIVGRSPVEVYGEDGGRQREYHYRQCVTSEQPVTFDETIYTVEGERVLETKLSPIRRSGRVVQLLGSSREVTQQKRFERELRYLSEMDMLTNIPNRRKISEELDRELSRAYRHGHPLSVLLIDVDHFKRVNDDLGHETGDAALRGLASTVEASLRPSDRLGRWGGEEFVVLLPETDREGALIAAERIRSAVEDACILEERPITVSIGVAAVGVHPRPVRTEDESDAANVADAAVKLAGKIDSRVDPQRGADIGSVGDGANPAGATGLAHSPESLLRIADDELYRAKGSGRNRVSG